MLKFHPLDVLEGLRPFTDQHGRSCVQFLDYGATVVLPIPSPQLPDFHAARLFPRPPPPTPRPAHHNHPPPPPPPRPPSNPEHRAFVVSRRIAADHPTKPSA